MKECDINEAIKLCRELEGVTPSYGYHVGLTGGCLYKDGPRKDIDIILYRILAREDNLTDLWEELRKMGFELYPFKTYHGVVKAKLSGYNVDFLIPHLDTSIYPDGALP